MINILGISGDTFFLGVRNSVLSSVNWAAVHRVVITKRNNAHSEKH
jgi:hypothetical protein